MALPVQGGTGRKVEYSLGLLLVLHQPRPPHLNLSESVLLAGSEAAHSIGQGGDWLFHKGTFLFSCDRLWLDNMVLTSTDCVIIKILHDAQFCFIYPTFYFA